MKFTCSEGCSLCCVIPEGEEKKIILFPEEVAELEKLITGLDEFAGTKHKFAVLEDMVFPDIKNKRIIVCTYRFYFIKSNSCAFFSLGQGHCRIHALQGMDKKPLACQAYPLAMKTIDATRKEYFLDTGCQFVEKNMDHFSKMKELGSLEEIESFLLESFPSELESAARLMRRMNLISLKLRQMEKEGLITLAGENFTLEDMNQALRDWGRFDLLP